MSNFFARQSAAFHNEVLASISDLMGIAKGLICDESLNDREIHFLNDWLAKHENISLLWPGSVLHPRLKAVLADGVVTEDERTYLTETLQKLIGGTLEELSEQCHVTELAFDSVEQITFPNTRFCLTGNFVFAKKNLCHEAIARRGGLVAETVSRKVAYLVVGGMGSPEWKHGSFGTKVESAMKLKSEGANLRIIKEDHWASALSTCPANGAGA